MVLFPPGESSSLSPRVCGVSDPLLCSVLPVHAGPAEATGQVRQETAFPSLRVTDLLTPALGSFPLPHHSVGQKLKSALTALTELLSLQSGDQSWWWWCIWSRFCHWVFTFLSKHDGHGSLNILPLN